MSNPRISALLRIPPIAMFIFVFAVGLAIEVLAFGAPHPAALTDPRFWIGLVLLVPAGYFGIGAWGLFRVRRLALMPGDTLTRLVDDGPFRFSRNPMYLGLALLHLGLCLLLGLPLTALMLLVSLAIAQFVVIPFEEDCMSKAFGSAYAEYRHRVRRWL